MDATTVQDTINMVRYCPQGKDADPPCDFSMLSMQSSAADITFLSLDFASFVLHLARRWDVHTATLLNSSMLATIY